MAVQLDLLDPEGPRSTWSRLPVPVRLEAIQVLAALLATVVRPATPAEEDADESREDSGEAPRS